MKILLSVFDKSSSGISTYTYETAKLLNKDVNITMLSFDAISSNIETIYINRVKNYRSLPLLNYFNNRDSIKNILDDFDIIHETLPPWAQGAKKYITTKWSYESFYRVTAIRLLYHPFPENLGALPVTLQHMVLDKLSRKKAKSVVSVSTDNSSFIPPPISLRRLKAYSSATTLKILFVSRDISIKRKNLKVLLEALKRTKRKYELHVVGNGKTLGISHGFLSREELINLMYEMDVLVLPSIYEELGYVGLEAYSIGLPVIASDIVSFRTVFKESPKFYPFDPIELSRILDSLDESKLELIGKRSWEHVKKTNQITREKFLNLYNTIYKSD